MAVVRPFRAWHYHPKRVAIERVVAPPYDVISEPYRLELHKRDPYNVIRLELGQAKAGEIDQQSRYEEARTYLDQWSRQGILTCEAKEGFYLDEMEYEHPFQKRTLSRLALFALLKLEPFERKIVFPHERTHASPKVDRGKLLRATRAHFSPVFMLYEDPTNTLETIRKACDSRPPLFDGSDDQKVRHRLWVIDDKNEIDLITSQFDRKRIFIADGHHRYETALGYAQELHEKGTGEGSWDYVMSTFVRFSDPGLLILPIHRVVLAKPTGRSSDFDKSAFTDRLKGHFVLHSMSRSVLEKVSEGAITEGFGLAFSDTECFLLELKDKTTARQMMPEGKTTSWYELDMNLISYLILEPLLEIKEAELEQRIFYTPSPEEAFEKLGEKEALCALFVRPVTPQIIKDVCESGELMPQKSTYFYPKFPSGLLIYRH